MMPHFEFTVLIFALRYAANRLSYAPGLVRDYAVSQIPRMSSEQRESLVREIEKLIRYQEYADDIAYAELMKLKQALQREVEEND